LGPAAVDRAAGIFTMAYSMGEVMGPILGGICFEAFGFAGECTVVSMACAGYGIFLMVLIAAKILPKSGTEFEYDEIEVDEG
jgi:MFS family permease